jgi:ribosomal protein S27E
MGAGLISVSCPGCGNDSSTLWAEEAGFTVVRCNDCALLYVNPRPHDGYIAQAVREGVHTIVDQAVSVRSRRIAKKVRFYKRKIALLFADLVAARQPVRWVDVGSGYGEFMEAALQVLPPESEVIGVEPMIHKANAARSRGLTVHSGYLHPGEFQADVISNIDVFSHIPDYASFLATMVTNLRPGGEVMIETGNLADLRQRSQFPYELGLPDHLVFAGRKQLDSYLRGAGLHTVAIREERFDTPVQMAKNLVKVLLGRESRVALPYTSDYRQLLVRARLAS